MLCTPYGEFKKNMMSLQAGQSGLPVRIAVNAGESDGAPIRDWSGCYKDRFMRILTVDELPYDDLSEKLFSKEAVFDVTAYAPMWLQHVYNGRFLDLTDFYQNDQLTTDDTRDGLDGDFFRNYLDYYFTEKFNRKSQFCSKSGQKRHKLL